MNISRTMARVAKQREQRELSAQAWAAWKDDFVRDEHGRFAGDGGGSGGGDLSGSGRGEAPREYGVQRVIASPEEIAEAREMADAKIANAPVPSEKAVEKARAELEKARLGEGRSGGDSRGGSADDRKRQRENLYKEFGGEERGYVVDPDTGLKMHWADPNYKGTKYDPKVENPNGYPAFERGKIFVKSQGGGYQLPNLLPEDPVANAARSDAFVRPENQP